MNLPTGCWIMVAAIAGFTVWTCLTTLGAAADFERRRRTLGHEVKELRKRSSYQGEAEPDDATGSDRKAA